MKKKKLQDELAEVSKGVEASLQAELKQVRRLVNDHNPNNDVAACNKLDEFLQKLQDHLAEGSLTPEESSQLSIFAESLKAEFGCN